MLKPMEQGKNCFKKWESSKAFYDEIDVKILQKLLKTVWKRFIKEVNKQTEIKLF